MHDDTELWSVLGKLATSAPRPGFVAAADMKVKYSEHARLKDHVNTMPGRLEAAIREGGK